MPRSWFTLVLHTNDAEWQQLNAHTTYKQVVEAIVHDTTQLTSVISKSTLLTCTVDSCDTKTALINKESEVYLNANR